MSVQPQSSSRREREHARRELELRWSSERMMIQWVRLGLSLYVLGFVVARFRALTGDAPAQATGWIGAIMVASGVLHCGLSMRRYRRDCQIFVDNGDLDRVPIQPLILALLTLAAGVLLLAYLLSQLV